MRLVAEHGVVCSRPTDPFGYFAWPTVTRTPDGTLVAVCSGLRAEHVCPFGKTVLFTSRDQGTTWSAPEVINNTPLDDRDAGILSLGNKSLLVSWFNLDIRPWQDYIRQTYGEATLAAWQEPLSKMTDEVAKQHAGSWVRYSPDGKQWEKAVRVPVSAPHGPIRLKNGTILYLGKQCQMSEYDMGSGPIAAAASRDNGKTWELLGSVPNFDKTENINYHEPHVVELPDGKLLGLIRYEQDKIGQIDFSMFQTESTDGGKTWTQARPTGVYGSPPHLMLHSSGALVCVYGYRKEPYGQRAMISWDQGKTWKSDYILRDDGPIHDLGYPASVELPDKRILTVYYQKTAANAKASIFWTRWTLPGRN